ncbi:MAG: ABC transporter permease [Rhizobiaceae bacterium MnEN-MB40S]|nr:MAG: ABC transporter permease [Rhizobiaceae bacterium MnEN-MB40S]
MIRFVFIRTIRAILTALTVVTTTFVVLRITGDPVQSLLPVETTPPEIIELYRRLWNLDQPLWQQYVGYWQGIFHGTMGRSFVDGRDVVGIIAERIPITLELMGWTFVAMLAIGLPAGIAAALNRGSWIDRTVMAAAVAGHALPGYVMGILMIWLFAVELRWLPSSGYGTPQHLIMPVLTLATAYGAVIARFTRAAVLEVLGQPHVLAARSQGWPGRTIMRREVIPNAAIPLVTIIGLFLGGLIGGSVIVEWIFAWPGIGRLLVTSVAGRDLAIVQALVLLFSATMIIANLLVDLAYAFLNPSIRLRG